MKAPVSLSMARQSHRVEIEEPKYRLNMSSTPSSRPHALGMEFSSEPRKVEGPAIRSKRGHTFSSAEPPQNSSVLDWIQNTPSLEPIALRSSSDGRRRVSPPKMVSLLAAGSGIASNLKTINEQDPFVNGSLELTGKKSSADPFAAMQAVVPYNNYARLVGQTSGMSVQLCNLTSNGSRQPTFAEAVDAKNLPFAETCRLAKDDTWGVVKIKNVSCRLVL
jgi:hypothetical protein